MADNRTEEPTGVRSDLTREEEIVLKALPEGLKDAEIEQFLRSLAITSLLVACAIPAATEAKYKSNVNMNAAEMEQFHDFLNSHPWFRTDLSKTPALVDDANSLRQHSELNKFLQLHPAI